MKILYTDIDYVLSLDSEPNKKNTKWGWVSPFNAKAVKVYNDIIEKTGAEIVISSDWKNHWTLEQLQHIFTEFAGIIKAPIGITPNAWGTKFQSLKHLEECRAYEILEHVKKYNPDAWVAIDDLNLSQWIRGENFVYLTRSNEGIKQSGKAEQVINKLMLKELEDEYFSDWKDESCANYVGWLKRFSSFNAIVSRENTAKAGIYDLTRVAPNINSASDPSGDHPEYWKDRDNHLTLDEVKKIILKYK